MNPDPVIIGLRGANSEVRTRSGSIQGSSLAFFELMSAYQSMQFTTIGQWRHACLLTDEEEFSFS